MNALSSYKVFDIAFRSVALILSLLLFAFIMVAGAQAALAASLKPQAVLTKDVLTVGDIFDNAGRNANYVLGPAPQPGKDMVLNTSTLLRIAMAMDLKWQPASSMDQIVVTRSATLVPADRVDAILSNALRDKVIDAKFTLDTGATSLEMILPHDAAPTVEVTNVTFNQRTNRFEATVSAPSAAQPLKQMVVTGSVRAMTTIPVLRHSLRHGDIISESDLEYVDFYTAEIQPDTLLKAEDVIGMTPRRMATPGKALRVTEILAPQLISRGEMVTIILDDGPLRLTASGKAMQNGAKGDIIRIVNNSSNRSLDGIVSGSGEVIVRQ